MVFGLYVFTAHQSGPWIIGRTPEDPLIRDSLTPFLLSFSLFLLLLLQLGKGESYSPFPFLLPLSFSNLASPYGGCTSPLVVGVFPLLAH